VQNQLCETSVSTIWDDLGGFRPLDVPLLFPESDPEFDRDRSPAEPAAEPRLVAPELAETKTGGTKNCSPLRAALYLRVSTRADKRDDDDARQEVEDELRLLRDFCEARGWSVVFESRRASTGRPVGRPRLTFPRDQVVELRRDGLSWNQIGRKVGASIASVRRAYQAAATSKPTAPGAPACPEVPEHA